METEKKIVSNSYKIKSVISGYSSINPVIINIDNRPLTNEELKNHQCSWLEDKSDKSSRLITFANHDSEHDLFQGTTNIKGNLCKTLLVLQSKKTNKVKLVEVSKCQLTRILQKPSLRTNYDNDEIETTYEENRTKLLKAFGSKKSNRASEIGSKMKINSDLMSSQIKNTAADVSVDLREIEQADQSVDTCLPPIHRDATLACEVYLIEDFLTQGELASMEDEAFTIYHLMPFTSEESGYSKFFIDSLEKLQNKVSIDKIKVLLYIEALIKFFKLPVVKKDKKITKKRLFDEVCPFSHLIANKVMENFTAETERGRVRNVTMEDKIVIICLALIIIACESFNIDEISRCFEKFSVKKTIQIARILGLTSKDKLTWSVKLPLPPQRSFFPKRRN